MKRILLRAAAIVLCALAKTPASADESPTRPILVVLAPERPLLIGFDVEVFGEEDHYGRFQQAWLQAARDEFQRLDADRDEQLSTDELAKASWLRQKSGRSPLARGLSGVVANLFAAREGALEGMAWEKFLQRRRVHMPAVTLLRDNAASRSVDRLWQQIDSGDDQQLDEAERTEAARQMARLDVDGDGRLARAELDATVNPFAVQRRGESVAYAGNVQWYAADDGRRQQLATQLKVKYQLPRLDAAGAWGERLRTADEDGDGELSVWEWERLLDEPPLDADFVVRLKPGPVGKAESSLAPAGQHGDGADDARPAAGQVVRGGGAAVRIVADAVQYDFKQQVTGTFDVADGDDNDYLDAEEGRRYFPFNFLFDNADADGDGKLYRDEVDEFLKVLERRQGMQIDLMIAERGRQVFDSLDADGNDLLDLPERREAAARLAALDADGDGAVAADELPQTYRIAIRPGQPEFVHRFFGGAIQSPQPPAAAQRGPDWFQLLDRNRDGLLERREFPGPALNFKQLDADADGLVTPPEAAAD